MSYSEGNIGVAMKECNESWKIIIEFEEFCTNLKIVGPFDKKNVYELLHEKWIRTEGGKIFKYFTQIGNFFMPI